VHEKGRGIQFNLYASFSLSIIIIFIGRGIILPFVAITVSVITPVVIPAVTIIIIVIARVVSRVITRIVIIVIIVAIVIVRYRYLCLPCIRTNIFVGTFLTNGSHCYRI